MSFQGQEIVNVNVGGTVFRTTLSTLCRDPDSMLARLFSDDWKNSQAGSSAADAFIDRDGTHFRYILNFLRDGSEAKLPSQADTLEELRVEARYFQLQGLVEMINTILANQSSLERSVQRQLTSGQMVRWKPEAIDNFWLALFNFVRFDEIRDVTSLSVIKDIRKDPVFVYLRLWCLACGTEASVNIERERFEVAQQIAQQGMSLALKEEMRSMTGRVAAAMENCVVVEWSWSLLLMRRSSKMHLSKSLLTAASNSNLSNTSLTSQSVFASRIYGSENNSSDSS